jgi:hypothetical protein
MNHKLMGMLAVGLLASGLTAADQPKKGESVEGMIMKVDPSAGRRGWPGPRPGTLPQSSASRARKGGGTTPGGLPAPPWWTPQDVAQLGAFSDDEVAKQTGRSLNAVRQKREALGIPNPARGPAGRPRRR